MDAFQFVLILARVLPADEAEDLERANKPSTFVPSSEDGFATVRVSIREPSPAEAVALAVRLIEGIGIAVLSVVDNDLVTLAEIAGRAGVSREALRRYSTGERGPGGFPPPVNFGRDGTRFWRWTSVVPWLRGKLGLSINRPDPSLAAANMLIQLRQLRHQPGFAALNDLLVRAESTTLQEPNLHV